MIRQQNIFDTVGVGEKPNLDGVVSQTENWIRVRFDYETNTFSQAHWQTESLVDFALVDPETGEPTRTVKNDSGYGWLVSPSQDLVAELKESGDLQRKKISKVQTSPEKLTEYFGPFDLRALGWSGSLRFQTHNKFRDWFDQAQAGRHKLTASKIGEHQKVRKYLASTLTGSYEYHDFVVDRDSGMIIQMNGYHYDDKTKERSVTSDEIKTDWTEINGLFVPTRISMEGYDYRPVRQGKRQWGLSNKQYDIHWFSVNEPLKESVLKGHDLENMGTLRIAVNPHASGATSIVEKIDDEKANRKRVGNSEN